MSNASSRRHWLIRLILISPLFIAGVVTFIGFEHALKFTNKMEFCVSCHTMKWNHEEYKETPHYQSASGVRATCADCHVPKSFLPKMIAKVVAAKDVYHQLLGTVDTKKDFEAHRWAMANKVWKKMKANDSRECRSCHSWKGMDLSEQDRIARKKHGRAEEKGKTCIDCHKGIAHEEPDEPDDEGTAHKTSKLEGVWGVFAKMAH